jgi:hypothetical protein
MPEMDGYVMLHTFKILVLDFFKFVVNFWNLQQ